MSWFNFAWGLTKVQEPEIVPIPIDPDIAIQAQLEQLYSLAYIVVLVLTLILFLMWLSYQFFKCIASTILVIGIITLLMIGIAISLTTPSPSKTMLTTLYNRHVAIPTWVYDGMTIVNTTFAKATFIVGQANKTSLLFSLFGMSQQEQ